MNITVRGLAEAKRLIGGVERQIPYAMAKAVNDVTLEARDYLKDRNRQAFIIRRPWVLNGWRVKLASKRMAPIKATLWLDPTRDFLAKFEAGGRKLPVSGSTVGIPIGARPTKGRLVPNDMQIKSFGLRRHTTSGGKVQIKGARGTFMVKTKAGALLLQRTTRMRAARSAKGSLGAFRVFLGANSAGSVRVLWAFNRSVPISPVLDFYETVGRYVVNEWPHVMGEALAHAIRTAR